MSHDKSRRHEHVVNAAEIAPADASQGTRFASRRWQLGAAAGARALGASLMEVPPGKTAWPRHYHAGNEEAIFVLEGEGALTLGEARVRVGAGDFVALPAGPDAAHQLFNDGPAPLRYLCVSTMNPTDVIVYPDSHKIGVMGGAAPGGDRRERFVAGVFRDDAKVGYWDGEG